MRNPDGATTSDAMFRRFTQSRNAKPYGLVGRKHAALHTVAQPVEHLEGDVLDLALRMVATLGRHPGLALAAPQVGVSLRVVVTTNAAIANPRITKLDGALIEDQEGCLSLPGRWFSVERFEHAEVAGINIATGEPWHAEATDLQARLWQHEVNHLDGVLISDVHKEIRQVG